MSVITPYQPALPPESDFTDAEIDFMENEPPALFPENQDSNFGFIIRKLFTDHIQELINQQDTIYNERFVDTSTQFLDEWEIQESVPVAPTGLDVATRQSIVLNRVRKGPFTRTMRKNIVENYIQATFGTPASFSPSGIPLDASGIPMFTSAGTLPSLYEIVEDIPDFLYHVYLDSSITVASGMQRELTRVTPAGIGFDITTVVNAAPRLYWKCDDPALSGTVRDLSQFAHPGIPGSGITLGVKGIITDPQTSAFSNNTLNGKISTASYTPFVAGSQRTFLGRAYLTSFSGNEILIGSPGPFSSPPNCALLFLSTATNVQWTPNGGSTGGAAWTAAWPGNNQWVDWALTVNDTTRAAELFINGVSKGVVTVASGGNYTAVANKFYAGGWDGGGWNGYFRNVAVYERILSAAEILSYAHGFTLS